MLPSSRELILNSPIKTMSLFGKDRLAVLSDNKELNIINLSTLKIDKIVPFSSVEHNNDFDYYERPLALNKNLAYIKISAKGKGYILNIQNKIDKVATLDYNYNKHVTQAAFSENGQYLVTGNEEGRVNVIFAEDGSLYYKFPNFADSISSIEISPENKFIVSSSFDKKIKILHVATLGLYEIETIDTIVEKIKFVKENIFIVITKDGRVIRINAQSGHIEKEVQLSRNFWLSTISVSESKKFIYIGTRESTLFALHIKTLDTMFCINLSKIGVTDMIRTPSYFIIGYKTGEIQFINHREFEKDFILAISLKNIKEAVSFFEKNIFLMTHRDTKSIYNIWLEVKDRVVNFVSHKKLEEARVLAANFQFHPKCRREMSEIEELQPLLIDFQRYIRSGVFHLAYNMVQRNPSLKQTILYTKLEDIWKKALEKAQILLSRDPVLNKEEAREILLKFEDIEEKKVLIENMINKASIFKRAETAIKNKNFNLYFKFVSENNFLKLTILYKKVISLAEKVKLNTITFLKENNYIKAIESAKLLNQFKPFAEESLKIEKFINSLILIDYHVKNKNLLEAVKVQNEINTQSTYKPILELENMKKMFVKKLLLQIEDGELDDIYEIINKFFGINIFIKDIERIMKSFYIAKIKIAFLNGNKNVNWSKTFQNYMSYFDFDHEIKDFFVKLNITIPKEKVKKIKKINFPENIIINV